MLKLYKPKLNCDFFSSVFNLSENLMVFPHYKNKKNTNKNKKK